jgi:hypothetical protein
MAQKMDVTQNATLQYHGTEQGTVHDEVQGG